MGAVSVEYHVFVRWKRGRRFMWQVSATDGTVVSSGEETSVILARDAGQRALAENSVGPVKPGTGQKKRNR